MAYADIVEMAQSVSLLQRVSAAAAAEGQAGPWDWTTERAWKFASQPGWADSWAYAKGTATVNVNPDTGARDDVINDQMVLTAVQAVRQAEATP